MNNNVELDVGMINVTLDEDVTDDEMNNELEFNLINALRIACNYFSAQDQKILWK